MKPYEFAVFDMDGTILDTLSDLQNSVNYALEKYGYPKRTYEEIRAFVGNGVRKLVERSLPKNVTKEQYETAFAVFKEHYSVHYHDKTKPYEGILQALQDLKAKNIPLAVVSNKGDLLVKELCARFFNGIFDVAVGTQEGYANKPAPDLVWLAMERMEAKRKKTVYIGDSEVDLQTAQNANLDCISVLWGFRDEAFIKEYGAKEIVSQPSELLSYFI